MKKTKSSVKISFGGRKISRARLFSFAVYFGAFIVVGILVFANIHPAKNAVQQSAASSQNVATNFAASSKLPVVTAGDAQTADIASVVATSSELNASDSAANRSISMKSILANAQTDVVATNKPTAINSTAGTTAITSYTVKNGENIANIATNFGVSDETLRQANNLTGDTVAAGTVLNVPAVDGVLYTTADGDSLASIAEKYGSNVENIVAINNLTGDTVPTGTRLLLPDGKVPAAPAPVATNTTLATRATGTGSGTITSSASSMTAQVGNRYYYGECTWYAYNRRVQLGLGVGSFWGNANTWAANAASAGFIVNHTPGVGAIFQTTSGYYGHVGVVESVNPDGTITISEMNYSGWAQVDSRVITNPSAYNYIH